MQFVQDRNDKQIQISQDAWVHRIRPDGKTPRYMVRNFGCQMNVSESQMIAGMLSNLGMEQASCIEQADVIVFHTCCVRHAAEQKVYGHLGALKEKCQAKPWTIVAVTGCMAQQPSAARQLMDKYAHVGIITGTTNLSDLPRYIYHKSMSGDRVIERNDEFEDVPEGLPSKRDNQAFAWVPVMHGCDNYCSYCIVPYVRGPERSRKPQAIYDEVSALVDDGVLEITLLGQNVNAYGKHVDPPCDFSSLLHRLHEIEGLRRIRFMTSHPKDIQDSLLHAMASLDPVCKHLHLPIQSGSDKILKEMNRRYDRKRYLEIIRSAREKMERLAITTDIMVGFPGETEQDFEDTLDMVRMIEFDMAYTFLYSKRTGTPAADRNDQIDEEVKKERFQRLLNAQNAISLKKNEMYIGKTVDVLIEGNSKTDQSKQTGRTDTNKIVNFASEQTHVGQIVSVIITGAGAWSLDGRLVQTKDKKV